MVARLIGTDSDNPRLPDVVIEASIGTTADDLAAGDTLAQANAYTDAAVVGATSGFIGAFLSNEAPAASSVGAGSYYWSLDLARPFWSDGAIWRDAVAVTEPPVEDLGQEVRFTLEEGAASFAPQIYLIAGATGTVHWYDSDDVLIATGPTPTITMIPDDNVITMKVESGAALVMSEVDIINLGFDHTQDTGPETPDAVYDYPAQPVVGISSLSGLANLRYFMAANTPLTGTLTFTNLSKLIAVECYDAEVEDVEFSGTIINRLCVERCRVTNLDLTPVASTIRDLRCAHGKVSPVAFHTDQPLQQLWHYCVGSQAVSAHIPNSMLPAVEQYWVWSSGITTMDPPTSPFMNHVLLYGNILTTATIDGFMLALGNNAEISGRLQAADSNPPSTSTDAARAALVAREWLVDVPASSIGGGSGWTYAAPTQVPWVSGDLTAINATPLVTSGVMSYASNAFSRIYQRPAARAAGDVFFEVVVDRTEVDGSAGSDWWLIFVNGDASGNGGVRASIRWPLNAGGDAAGVFIGTSNSYTGSAGTVFRMAANPVGWTTAGNHKIGLLHQGDVAQVLLDGVKVFHSENVIIDGYAGGGYVGVGGDTDTVSRQYQSWGITNI